MLPTLRVLADGKPHGRAAVTEAVADHFGLSDAERRELLPSGKMTVIRSRVGWAVSYMKQAGLISAPRRGVYQITERGRQVLARKLERIDVALLEEFEEFKAFRARSRTAVQDSPLPGPALGPSADDTTPEEALEHAYQQLRREVEAELLDQVKAAPPSFFERLVVDLLLQMGYGGSRQEAGSVIGGTGDGGIDGIINEDRLGLDVVYIQAKRWTEAVGRPEIQKFAGALQGHRAKKGVFITTSSFSRDAEDYAARIDSRIVLIDGRRLARLMYDHNVGVSRRVSYEVKQVDSDYFGEE
ncbi:MAG TPA: restriction endonuclease [Gemmatimonadales bacterium]|nr:restriction endonuclease [Gemmatimonadales bacterium]